MAELLDLSAPRRIHLVGVGGAGISAIGVILATMGHQVSGTDVNPTGAWPRLEAAGVALEVVARDQLFAAAPAEAEILAHSTAFKPSDADRAAAADRGAVIVDRAGILGAICAQRPTVAVSGTHGKTSTSAMIATLLDAAGAAPSFLIGATPVTLGEAARWQPYGGVFAVEADESDGSFLALGADVAVVTNVDEDHLDFWGDLAAIRAAFTRFVAEARTSVLCIDDPRAEEQTDPWVLALARDHGGLTVGERPEARLRISEVVVDRLTTAFDLHLDGEALGRCQIGTPGRHHARNAAVAVGVALEQGIDAAKALAAVGTYAGVSRRFEVIGEAGGVTVVDDYAHNPGKVRALLASAAEAGWDRVVAIFQPHRYTRTRDLLTDFGRALALADVVAITDVYAAGESPIEGITGKLLVDATFDERPWAEVAWAPTLADARRWARSSLRPGDLVLTIGAGDVFTLGPQLLEDRPGGVA